MAGFKDFVDGSPLYEAEIDGYLMKQTVMRFATLTALTTALGAGVRENGMLAYADDTKLYYMWNGTAWVQMTTNQTNGVVTITVSGTTDASGFLTVTHGLGFTPSLGGWFLNTNPASNFAVLWGMDTIGATTLRCRFMNASTAGALNAGAVSGRLYVLRP
jgi:hypothetical protein